MEPLVDGLSEAELTDEQLDGADAAAGDRPGLVGDFVLDVGRGDDRLWRWRCDGSIEPAADFPLAGGVMAMWNGVHSKSPWGDAPGISEDRSKVPETTGAFEFFPHHPLDSAAETRLVKR